MVTSYSCVVLVEANVNWGTLFFLYHARYLPHYHNVAIAVHFDPNVPLFNHFAWRQSKGT